ncbi:TPA: SpaH/EbpB family LPXTG-anchored major pilin [Streptococcus suis]|nr:SpaH/EbpB family LPXTG-anchored major pilin [Streptococcus suis]HEM4855389.1 SpaH/EbpB family LPXTG-anchored major pilin [Streptococcus suis]
MKKIANLLLTAFAALLMVFSSFGSVTAFAQDNAPKPDEKYDIVLTKVKLSEDDIKAFPKGQGKDDYDGSKLDPAAFAKYFGTSEVLEGVHFELHQGTKDAVGALVKEDKTNADGIVKFTDLPAGKYVIVENKSKSVLKGNDELANSAAVPLEIELPVFKAGGGWFTTGDESVHVYPKNTVHKPTIDKVVNDADKHDTALIGQTKTFKITSVMPEGIKDYVELTFNDTFSKGLSYKGNLKVTKNDVEVVASADTFTVKQPNVGTKAAEIEVKFAEKYIKDLNPKDKIVITYDAVINEDAVLGAPNANEVQLTYGNNPDNKKKEKPGETPELHTGGKRFEKQDKATGAKLGKAEFKIKNEAGKFLKQENNVNTWGDEADATVFKSADGTGYFEVKGLPYGEEKTNSASNAGSTKYFLKEIKAPDGYALLTQEIEFTVDSTSYNQNPTEIVLKPTDPQVVNNNKVTIPQTGGIGSVVVIAAGILVAGLGLVLKRRMTK